MDFPYSIKTLSGRETCGLGAKVSHHIKPSIGKGKAALTVFLDGKMGSGKTTFSRGFARGLGISGRIVSPTYVFVRRYPIPETQGFLYHIDCYRLKGGEGLDALGIRDFHADPDSVLLIEWPKDAISFLSEKGIHIRFDITGDRMRSIRIEEQYTA